ncbi:hypothetical protein [Nonomuraea sp. B19D2]|uniref:hypothetical protein n=1 Tax=Nonomuraea sp. B19D2 TaxID=3159561 RepID=UPI0032DA188B
MAVVYRLTLDQGATFRRVLRWLKGESPVDLTGFSARMEIRDKAGGSLLYRLDTTNGGISLGGAEGTVILHLPAATSAAWSWRTGVYDLELIEPNGDVTRLIQGGVQINPEVTTGV